MATDLVPGELVGSAYSPLLEAAAFCRKAKTPEKQRDYVKTVQLLIKAGANVNFCNGRQSPVSAALGTIVSRDRGPYEPKSHQGASREVHAILKRAGGR